MILGLQQQPMPQEQHLISPVPPDLAATASSTHARCPHRALRAAATLPCLAAHLCHQPHWPSSHPLPLAAFTVSTVKKAAPTAVPQLEVSFCLLVGEKSQFHLASLLLNEECLSPEHPVLYGAGISSLGQPEGYRAAADTGGGYIPCGLCQNKVVQRQRCPMSVRLALEPGVDGIPGWEGDPLFT